MEAESDLDNGDEEITSDGEDASRVRKPKHSVKQKGQISRKLPRAPMSDRSDDSEAADESSSDDDAATKDLGVPGPLRDPLRGESTRGDGTLLERGVTGPLRGDAAGRRRRQTRVATGAT